MKSKEKSQFYTQNRELSWLKFNERVLEEAMNIDVPLLERLKFISIFATNLDEFFMIRVGTLFDLMAINPTTIDRKSGLTPQGQLQAIYDTVLPLYEKKDKAFQDLATQLRNHDIYDLEYSELEPDEQKAAKQYFKSTILPILSPQIVDSHHPFPHIQNNIIHVAAMLKHKNKEVFGIIPLPTSVSSVFYLTGHGIRYIRLERLIVEFIDLIFENYQICEAAKIRVTRNEDINFDDENFYASVFKEGREEAEEEIDFRKKVQKLLSKRKRLAPVRLEVSTDETPNLVNYLCERLPLAKEQVIYTRCPMVLGVAFSLQEHLSETKQKTLTYKPFVPQLPKDIDMSESIIKQIQKKDILLSYPYESMQPFLQMIKEAAHDPNVLSIKITIYRLASKTKMVEYLCAAAENGKEVTVLIELRARFDEQNNIDWSERLEEAGCNIIYGFEHYKVHSKICLITRKDRGEIKYITQIGTGNYNEKTAKLYTDLSLLTYDQRIGKDAAEFFKNMAIGNLKGSYEHIIVAPVSLKPRVMKLIDEQIALGEKGQIFIKINSLADDDIIEKLRDASRAGVKVKLIIRGICCILPNIKGETENIEITSIVGRMLEHSRVYSFGTGEKQKMYIASADFLLRNTERRVEVGCPIYDIDIKEEINLILEDCYYDNIKSRVLQPDGEYIYKKIARGTIEIDSQELFMDAALKNASAPKPAKKVTLKNRLKKKLRDFVLTYLD